MLLKQFPLIFLKYRAIGCNHDEQTANLFSLICVLRACCVISRKCCFCGTLIESLKHLLPKDLSYADLIRKDIHVINPARRRATIDNYLSVWPFKE